MSQTLRDPRTSFVVVTTLEPSPAQEAAAFCAELATRGFALGALVFNRALPVTLREERRVEEAPTAYKKIGPVIAAQEEAGLLQSVARLKPLLTFKA